MLAPGARARSSRRLLIYLHVPFCSAKCHFCDWVVGYDKYELLDAHRLRDRYVTALCAQIGTYGSALGRLDYTVTNVYWGGGTPTRLSPDQLGAVHNALAGALDLSGVVEYTAECSPETITAAHLEVWAGCGLGRISIGVQSFDDTVLRRMGRPHSGRVALEALDLIRAAGVENFNIDLIVGFPEQPAQTVIDAVQSAVDLAIPHVSLYMFREFSTGLVAVRQERAGWRGQVSHAVRAQLYRAAKRMFEQAGYEEYMVGYFAREPRFQFDGEQYYFGMVGDYFGFGAGAASTIGRCALRSGEPSRYGSAQVRDYVDRPAEMHGSTLAVLPDEVFMQNYLKVFATREGLRFDRWRDQFGFEFAEFRAARPGIQRWFSDLERAGARFVETAEGIRLTEDTWVDTMMWRR
jgi:coproporphyrinogen III oxidase-like Fe-S oxidoreductase